MDSLDADVFRLDMDDGRLWHGKMPVCLRRKTFDLLCLLAQNPRRLLTKREILRNVWRGLHVSEALVKECIHELRRALYDDPRHPTFIQTVHGRGYRFIGELDITENRAGEASSTAPPMSIAVLPLQNLTGEERWTRVCRGISDDIVTELARSSGCSVAPAGFRRDQYSDLNRAEIARRLMVDHILSGSLQSCERLLRINLHLTQVESGRVVWAERIEREADALNRLQMAITTRVRLSLG